MEQIIFISIGLVFMGIGSLLTYLVMSVMHDRKTEDLRNELAGVYIRLDLSETLEKRAFKELNDLRRESEIHVYDK